MENVYVIKVRTKPPLSSLYPSERRYSASTVGGLSLVHFGLGALSLLLGSLALSLQGPILSVACLVPFVTGLFAWRRWYIDRNIAIFFYGSLFSLTAAILCFIATIFDVAAAAQSRDPLWPLEKIFDQENRSSRFEQESSNGTLLNNLEATSSTDAETFHHLTKINSYSPTPGIILDNMSNISGYILRSSTIDPDRPDEIKDPSTTVDNGGGGEGNLWKNVTEESLETMNGGAMSLVYTDYRKSFHTKILLTVNVLVASLLEAFWSALSVRIALRGMMNRLPESSYANGTSGSGKLDEMAIGKRKAPAPTPDILDHDRRLSESLQNLTARHNLRNSGPRLPLPESSNEFRERVERFLANQAAHHVAEGSCS